MLFGLLSKIFGAETITPRVETITPRVVLTDEGYILKCTDIDGDVYLSVFDDQTICTCDLKYATRYDLDRAKKIAEEDGKLKVQKITTTYMVDDPYENQEVPTTNKEIVTMSYILEHVDGENLFRNGNDQSLGTEDIRSATRYNLELAERIADNDDDWRVLRLVVKYALKDV
ncbi:MAG: hypothetical protein IKE91_07990 [Clostridia bacterium]|nr:hypothetical protein [Clostridia bacterium]